MTDTILSKFQKLGKRNKPLYKKANAFMSGLNQVLKVNTDSLIILVAKH